MKKKHLVILISIIITILGFLFSEQIDYVHLEPRNHVLNIIADGFIFFLGISLLLIVIIRNSFKNNSYIFSIVLSPFLIIAIIITFSCTQCMPNYIDVAVYHNDKKSDNKLVFQYFETGIGGNPHARALITDNVSAPIRKIQILNEKLFPDSLLNIEGATRSRFPKTLRVDSNLYLFEKFNDMCK